MVTKALGPEVRALHHMDGDKALGPEVFNMDITRYSRELYDVSISQILY